jgi:hypothetical protein
MKSLLSRFSVVFLLLIANGLFWIVFAALFIAKSYPYTLHRPTFEEITADYIFFGRALKLIDTGTGIGLPPLFVKVTYAVQWPSAYTARPFFWYFNRHGISVDHQYWGTSLGGYYLLLICLLSFLQSYLVGLLVDYVRKHFIIGRGLASGSPGHAFV